MFQRREIGWIGFQEVQKSISSLKQEVEVAEKKLLGFKKSFNERSKTENFEIDSLSKESVKTFKSKDYERSPHLDKEAVSSVQKISSDDTKNTLGLGIPKTSITTDEEPNFLPAKSHFVEPLEFKNEYKYSLNRFLSSSETSFSSSDVKYSSSERTSSLIANTHRDPEIFHRKNETKVKQTMRVVKESFPSSVHDQDNDIKDKKIELNKKSRSVISKDNGIEWKEGPVNKASLLQKTLKPDNHQKLKDIIDRQKKKYEEHQLKLEKDFSSDPNHFNVNNFKASKEVHHLEVTEDNEVTSVPVRKVCVVKSLPVYKGFCAPSKSLLLASRRKKQKNKHTIATPVSSKNSPKVIKRIKTVVKYKSDIASTHQSKNTVKAKDIVDRDKKSIDGDHTEEVHTESIKDISKEEKNKENHDLSTEQQQGNDLKTDIQSILNEFQPVSKGNLDDNEESIKDGTFSYDVETKSVSSKIDIDQNSAKENTKPKIYRSIKKKAKKSPEQKVSSPKVRHYDVEKVREYIKKKKKERLKRHQEEVRKQVFETQKKKESLEKLFEYQKQITKSTTEGKPLSPIKIYHKDSGRREHENKPENFIHKNTENVFVEKAKKKDDQDVAITSVDVSKDLQHEEFIFRGHSIKNQTDSSMFPKTENMQEDISGPKLISVAVTPLLDKPSAQCNNVNDSAKVVSLGESPAKKKKKVSKPEHPNKTSVDLLPDKQISKENNSVIATKSGNIDNMDGFSFEIPNDLDNIYDMSTLSEISEVQYVNVDIIKNSRRSKRTSVGFKSNEGDVLRNLMKSINEMTKPLEPFLRTKQWIDENPLPPKLRKTRFVEKVDVPKQQPLPCTKDSDFNLTCSPTKTAQGSSFKEHVSGIGDVSQLYTQILGKKSTDISEPSHEPRPALPPDSTEDEIIEGSLNSDGECIFDENQTKIESKYSPEEAASSSSHFSDFQRANVSANPFNLINTYERKPLGLRDFGAHITMNNTNSKQPENYAFSKNCNSKVLPSGESNVSKSHLNENAESSSLSQVSQHSPLGSAKETASHLMSQSQKDSVSDIVSGASKVAPLSDNSIEDGSEDLSSKHTVISQVMSEQTFLSKDAVGTKESDASVIHRADTTEKGITELQSSIPLTSTNKDKQSPAAERTVSNHSPKNIPDGSATGMTDVLLSGTINSEYSLEIDENSEENAKSVHSEVFSDVIIEGTINTDYTLDVEMEESVKEERQNSNSEKVNVIEHKKTSASESSISEDIVDNLADSTKSTEESNKTSASSKKSDISSHSKASNTINNNHQSSSGSSEDGSTYKQHNASNAQNQQSLSALFSDDPQNYDEHSNILLQRENISSIPQGSQKSITIDLRQPLRLTLSNGESAHSSQRLNLQDDQYLHTQVITRIASEVAAAAASSSVKAFFETHKAFHAEKNYLELINSSRRSVSSKKTQYSSDFESSQAAKSSSQSPHSSTDRSKHSDSVPDDIVSSNNGSSSKNGSVKEQISSKASSQDLMEKFRSSQIFSKENNKNIASTFEDIVDESIKMPERSNRKISGNISSPSPASLSDKESGSSETLRSSLSHVSNLSDSELSSDSFHQLSLNVVRNMVREDEVRARHQLSLLQIQEKNLVEKARADMMLLESLKQKYREKGLERKYIKRKQKDIITRLKEERTQLQKMQATYRNICEKHLTLSDDKKKLPKQPSSTAFQLLNKDEKSHATRYPELKAKDIQKLKPLSSTSTILSDYDEKTVADEDSISEVPEVFKSPTSNSSQESIVENQLSEKMKISNSSQTSHKSAPNPSFSPLVTVQSNSNPSLHSSNSVDSAVQGLKKLEASKRHLTKREQRILQRRKQVETLLQWKKKLDKEEKAVRELEQKALDLVDQSKTKAKYYVSSSGSNNQEEIRNENSLQSLVETSTHLPEQSEGFSKQLSNEMDPKAFKNTSDESIPTNLSENATEEYSESEKGIQNNSNFRSKNSSSQDTKPGSGEQSIHTVESAENSSQAEEVASEEISNHVSPATKDKSSSSDIYSESFESSVSKKSSSVVSISTPFKDTDSPKSLKKGARLGIRPPLVPRNMRRHDSSGSDDSYTISHSETASDQSDIEVRIHALAEELKRRRAEAEKLKREQKKKYREQLKEKELSLQKQLEAYNQYIQQTKLELDHQIESAVSPPQTNDIVIKPQIKWPRPDQVIESRRVRKQAVLSPDTFTLEKKSEFVNNMSESAEKSEVSKDKDKVVRTLFPEPKLKTSEEIMKQDISGKLPTSSSEISEALSVSNSSEIQEVSEVEQSNSTSSKILSEVKDISQANASSINSSVSTHKTEEAKSLDSDMKEHSLVLSSDENKNSHDDITESKSQTDTFITESTSSKSSEFHSPQQNDETILSNKTVSIEEEQFVKTDKEVSEDDIHNLGSPPSHEISDESSNSDNSVSDAQSVINSGSVVEESEKDCSSKNSKCNSPKGCETSSINELIDSKNTVQKLLSPDKEDKNVLLDLACPVELATKNEQKEIPPESKIVNIVTFLSSSLIEDTFKTLFHILKEKGVLRIFLNKSPFETKFEIKSLSLKKRTTETLAQSLFDMYMNDTFTCLFRIINRIKNKSEKPLLFVNSLDSQCTRENFPVNIPNQNLFATVNDATKFSTDSISSGVNETIILTKSNEGNTESLSSYERNQQLQQLEQQLILQQYSYFYRKIPNKPPPPYTPPSSSSLSSEFPFVKGKTVEKVTPVKEVLKNVDQIMCHAVERILAEKQKGLALSDVLLDADNFIENELHLTMPHQSSFAYYIMDLTKEVILEKFSETKNSHKPWLRPHKLTPKPLIPASKEVIITRIHKEVKRKLKIDEDTSNTHQKTFSWSSLKLGRKKRDFVDTILISELKEEEPDWVNYDQDEMTVKLQIADSIFNILICDTINVIKELQQKIDL